MMEGLILDIIKSIINENRINNQEPLLSDTNEVGKELSARCKEALVQLQEAGKIEMGETLNYEWIKLL